MCNHLNHCVLGQNENDNVSSPYQRPATLKIFGNRRPNGIYPKELDFIVHLEPAIRDDQL